MKVTVDADEVSRIVYEHLCQTGVLNSAWKHWSTQSRAITFQQTDMKASWVEEMEAKKDGH